MAFDVEFTIGADAAAASSAVGAFGSTASANLVLMGQQIDRAIGQFSQLASAISDSMGETVDSFAGFDQSMANVKSITTGTNEQFAEMNQLAKDLASQMPTTSTAIADGFFQLASSGLDANEIMEVTPAIMNLAAAASTDFETAANGVTAAIATYGLGIDDANLITEVFQNTNVGFKTTMPELAESLKFAGSAAAVMGVDFQTTAAAIGLARNAGLDASTAGTGLRTVMLRLAKPTKAASDAMGRAGFEMKKTADGSLDMEATFKDLKIALEGIAGPTDRAAFLTSVFGKQGIAVATTLAQNSDGLRELADSLTTEGTVADAVAIQNAGLENQMKILSGSIEEQQNILGERLAPAALKAERAKLKLLEAVNKLPGPLVEVGGGAILIAAEMGKMLFPVVQAGIQLGILFAAMSANATATGASAAATATHTGTTGVYTIAQTAANLALSLFPIVIIILGIAILIAAIVLLVQNWDKVTDVMKTLWEFISGVFVAAFEGLVSLFQNVADWIQNNIDLVIVLTAVFLPFIGIPALIIKNWEAIGDFFSGLFSGIFDMFGDLIDGAVAWGADFVGNFVSGLVDNIPLIGGAASGILDSIGGFLSFDESSNDAMAMRWGLHLGQFMAQGLTDSTAELGAASSAAIGAVATAPIGGVAGVAGGGGGGVTVIIESGAVVVSGAATIDDGERVALGLQRAFIRQGAFSGR